MSTAPVAAGNPGIDVTKAEPVEPKRERGRLRVQAILDAAAAVLAEKGYEAATMSEVAACSRTAVGSLYRFFPTKEALAQALSQRFVVAVGARLDDVAAQASAMTPAALADALIGVMTALRQDRAAVVSLLDAARDGEARRSVLRVDIVRRLTRILKAACERGDVDAPAAVILHMMKGVSRFDGLPGAEENLVALRRALTLYLADVLSNGTGRNVVT